MTTSMQYAERALDRAINTANPTHGIDYGTAIADILSAIDQAQKEAREDERRACLEIAKQSVLAVDPAGTIIDRIVARSEQSEG